VPPTLTDWMAKGWGTGHLRTTPGKGSAPTGQKEVLATYGQRVGVV